MFGVKWLFQALQFYPLPVLISECLSFIAVQVKLHNPRMKDPLNSVIMVSEVRIPHFSSAKHNLHFLSRVSKKSGGCLQSVTPWEGCASVAGVQPPSHAWNKKLGRCPTSKLHTEKEWNWIKTDSKLLWWHSFHVLQLSLNSIIILVYIRLETFQPFQLNKPWHNNCCRDRIMASWSEGRGLRGTATHRQNLP